MSDSKERADFEAECLKRGLTDWHLLRDFTTGDYGHEMTRGAWLGWQARAQQQTDSKTPAMHAVVRKVLQHHNLTKAGDGVVEADLIYAVLGCIGLTPTSADVMTDEELDAIFAAQIQKYGQCCDAEDMRMLMRAAIDAACAAERKEQTC